MWGLQEIVVPVGVALGAAAVIIVLWGLFAVAIGLVRWPPRRPGLPRWVKRLACRVLGHDTWSYSATVAVPSLPQVERVGVWACTRCGDKAFTVNQI